MQQLTNETLFDAEIIRNAFYDFPIYPAFVNFQSLQCNEKAFEKIATLCSLAYRL